MHISRSSKVDEMCNTFQLPLENLHGNSLWKRCQFPICKPSSAAFPSSVGCTLKNGHSSLIGTGHFQMQTHQLFLPVQVMSDFPQGVDVL